MLDMDQFKAFMNEAEGFNHLNGLRCTVVEEGYCEAEVEITKNSMNPQGVVHGSLLFALCDLVTGMATATTGRSMLTQAAHIHYLRPGTGKKLTAKSRMVHNGRQTALCIGEVFDGQGRLLVTSQFEVFYTTDHLTLPERGEDGQWHAPADKTAWQA